MTKIVLPRELLNSGYKHFPADSVKGASEHFRKGDKAYFWCFCGYLTEVNLRGASKIIDVSCDKNSYCGKVGKNWK